jgi:hypothetical protein
MSRITPSGSLTQTTEVVAVTSDRYRSSDRRRSCSICRRSLMLWKYTEMPDGVG